MTSTDSSIFTAFSSRLQSAPRASVVRLGDSTWPAERFVTNASSAAVRGREPRLLIADDPVAFIASFLNCLRECRPAVIVSNDAQARSRAIEDLRRHAGWQAPDGVACVIYTSGSSGRMVGVMVSEASFLTNSDDMREFLGDCAGVTWAVCSPLTTSYGLSVGVALPLIVGGTIAPLRYQNPRVLLDALFSLGPSILVANPVVLKGLLGYPELLERVRPSLVQCLSSGEPLPETTMSRYRNIGLSVIDCYGSTETSGIAACDPARWSEFRPFPSVEIRLSDREGHSHRGSLQVRSRKTMLGYWGDSAPSKMKEVDGWLDTGDLVELQASGNFRLLGRASSLVKIAGHRVHLDLVERELESLPEVAEALVLPTASPSARGETLSAYVRLAAPSAQITPRELRRAIGRALPQYMIPKHVVIVGQLQRAGTKKVRVPPFDWGDT